MWKFLLTLIPYTLKTIGNFRLFGDFYKNAQSTQKNVTLFHLGHWVRIKVGGVPYIVRRKTLSKYPGSVLASIAIDDKITTKSITEFIAKPFIFVDESKQNQKQFLEDQLKDHYYDTTMNTSNGGSTSSSIKLNENTSKNLNISEQLSQESKDEQQKQKNEEKYQEIVNNLTLDEVLERCELETQAHIMDGNRKLEKNKSKKQQNIRHNLTFEKDHDGYYLIDRESKYFEVILNFLRCGEIFLTVNLDLKLLMHEARFYHLYELESTIRKRINQEKRLDEKLELYNQEFDMDLPVNSMNFILPKKWFDQWKQFIDDQNDKHPHPPDTIDSRILFKSISNPTELKEGLELNKDYVCLKKSTWLFLNRKYKYRGPILIRSTSNIYDPLPLKFQNKNIWNIK
ncbi:hypothetical protein DLAC_05429 [Tieghemostelium lacteum]|uniref:DUSP domain-containing protein n=1 Tax=Tieghemostelium lacteum TaxID=361077 RepID=A0A151ZFY5_TIELA|nr:hypothetical protein DLAC_05429 [Tieghemostelium lacteum]|eukprot:KYQ92845.1 hypothetical protein DLAC_05429 [Tieghemostelium lacteum]